MITRNKTYRGWLLTYQPTDSYYDTLKWTAAHPEGRILRATTRARIKQKIDNYMKTSNDSKDPSNKEFVVLRGIQHDNVFFTTNTPGEDPTLLADGEVGFDVLGYADTCEQAQTIIAAYNLGKYGDADFPLKLHVAKMMARIEEMHL